MPEDIPPPQPLPSERSPRRGSWAPFLLGGAGGVAVVLAWGKIPFPAAGPAGLAFVFAFLASAIRVPVPGAHVAPSLYFTALFLLAGFGGLPLLWGAWLGRALYGVLAERGSRHAVAQVGGAAVSHFLPSLLLPLSPLGPHVVPFLVWGSTLLVLDLVLLGLAARFASADPPDFSPPAVMANWIPLPLTLILFHLWERGIIPLVAGGGAILLLYSLLSALGTMGRGEEHGRLLSHLVTLLFRHPTLPQLLEGLTPFLLREWDAEEGFLLPKVGGPTYQLLPSPPIAPLPKDHPRAETAGRLLSLPPGRSRFIMDGAPCSILLHPLGPPGTSGRLVLLRRSRRIFSPRDQELLGAVAPFIGHRLEGFFALERATQLQEELDQVRSRVRALEQQLAEAERLSSLHVLGAGVAHEINNPLGAIMANANFLKSYAEDSAELEAIEDIITGVTRCQEITGQLMEHARKSGGEVAPVSLNAVIIQTTTLLRRRLEEGRISLSLQLEDPPPVQGNEREFAQIFTNLVLNARDAILRRRMAAGPRLITIRTRAAERAVIATVEDTGTGIPEEILGKIFEPFFTSKEPGQGTGMGLFISSQIAKKHGGRIEVETREGKGTRMAVIFPLPAREDDPLASNIEENHA